MIHLGKPRRRVDIHHFIVAKKAVFLVWVKAIIQLEVIPYKVAHLVTLLLEGIHHFTVTNLVLFKVWLLRNPETPSKKVILNEKRLSGIDNINNSPLPSTVTGFFISWFNKDFLTVVGWMAGREGRGRGRPVSIFVNRIIE